MIKFKHNELEEQFEVLDDRLQVIGYALSGYIAQEMGKDLIITSVYRGDNKFSTHKYYRAFDFRVEPAGGDAIYTPEEIEKIKRFCAHFIYSSNPKKYKFKTLKVHGPVKHGHCQVNGEGVTELA